MELRTVIMWIVLLAGFAALSIGWFMRQKPETQRKVAAFLGKVWTWLRRHGQELVGIPAALVVFYASGLLLRWFDPSSGAFDAGILHKNAVVIVSLLVGSSIARFGTSLNIRWFTSGGGHAIDKRRLFVIFLAAYCWLSAGIVSAHTGVCEQRGAAVVEAARQYEGVREATGRNDGPAVERMLARTGLPKGNAWCGAYAYACFEDAGVGLPGGARAYAWAPTWHPKARRVWERGDKGSPGAKAPMPGDVFGLYYANLKRIGHVGIVESWGAVAITWEGNTNGQGSREGDGVYRKRRLRDQIHCVSRWTC